MNEQTIRGAIAPAMEFALGFQPDGVQLLRRQDGAWTELRRADFSGDLRGALGGFVQALRAANAPGLALVIPEDQILYTDLTLPLIPGGTEAALRQALDGLTPYRVEDLAFDFAPASATPGHPVKVAAVARQTLQEAEDFAVRHGFAPDRFVAAPLPGQFPHAPDFGATELAAEWARAAELAADLASADAQDAAGDTVAPAVAVPSPATPPQPAHPGPVISRITPHIGMAALRAPAIAAPAAEAVASVNLGSIVLPDDKPAPVEAAAPIVAQAGLAEAAPPEAPLARPAKVLPDRARAFHERAHFAREMRPPLTAPARSEVPAPGRRSGLSGALPMVGLLVLGLGIVAAISNRDPAPAPEAAQVEPATPAPTAQVAPAQTAAAPVQAASTPTAPVVNAPVVAAPVVNAPAVPDPTTPSVAPVPTVPTVATATPATVPAAVPQAMPPVVLPRAVTQAPAATPSAATPPAPAAVASAASDVLRESAVPTETAPAAPASAETAPAETSPAAPASAETVPAAQTAPAPAATRPAVAASVRPKSRPAGLARASAPATQAVTRPAPEAQTASSRSPASRPVTRPQSEAAPRAASVSPGAPDSSTLRSSARPKTAPSRSTPARASATPDTRPAVPRSPQPYERRAQPEPTDSRPPPKPAASSNQGAALHVQPAPVRLSMFTQAGHAAVLARLDQPWAAPAPQTAFPLIRTAQARPSKKPTRTDAVDDAVAAALSADRPAARASTAATEVPVVLPRRSSNAAGLNSSGRPHRRPSGLSAAGSASTSGLSAATDAAVEEAIASAVSASSAVPGRVALTALSSSARPLRRGNSAPAATESGAAPSGQEGTLAPVPEADGASKAAAEAAALAERRRLDDELQRQAEQRARSRAASDAQAAAQAKAAAEARARAQAEAEAAAAARQNQRYRPPEVDNEPEVAAAPSGPTSSTVAGSATNRGIDLNATQLIGTVGAGKASRGLIRLRNGKIVTVRLGDKINGGQITQIGNGGLQYVKAGKQYALPILNGR